MPKNPSSSLFITALGLCVALALPAAGKPASPNQPPTAPSAEAAPQIPFEKYTLANGLEVILHRDSSLPLVASSIWYHVGPANEAPGRSGFAHLFEHLMFEGSKYAGKQFDTLLESVGATNVNGTTSWDRTNYFETVPSNQLELVLWLESDRMGYMIDALTQERLDVQRGVVKNERRQSYENQPYGPSSLALYDIVYPKGHPYHGAVIGSMEDLDRASLDDVKQFFKAYYAPSNATLTLAGDFEPEHVKQLIEKYFGPLPSTPRPVQAKRLSPPLATTTRLTVTEPVDLAKLTLAWLAPPAFTPDEMPLEVLTTLLASGKSSRLYQDLVVKKKLASDVSAYVDANAVCSEVEIEVVIASGKTADQAEHEVDAALRDLAAHGPTEAELTRAKRKIELELRSSLQLLNGHGGEDGRAGMLQRLNHYLGDPGKLSDYWNSIQSVSASDVRRVAAEDLKLDARAVVTTLPKSASTEEKP